MPTTKRPNIADSDIAGENQTMTQAKNTICLWYDKDAEEAANFYAVTFPDSSVTARVIRLWGFSGRK